MTCLDPSRLAAFSEGLLSGEALDAFDDHIAHCQECYALAASVARRQAPPASPAIGPSALLDAAAAELTEGDRVGRYLITGLLGIGGMGVAYAAFDPELQRTLALKLLRRDAAAARGTGEERHRLVREARAMARLAHPNVVALYDAGSHGDRLFIAMELVRGRSLRRWLEEEPRTWQEVLGVMLAAGRGLAASHQAGIIHGDFKPENVLVGDDGRARVSDFGVARILASPEAPLRALEALAEAPAAPISLTRSGVLRGTPRYMALEQLEGRPADARTDQFAYAAVLYEALHGEPPFAGDGIRTLAAELRAERLRPPRRRVPAWLRRAVARGLRLDPSARHASMDQLLRALEREARPWAAYAAAAVTLAGLAVGGTLFWRFSQAQRLQRCQGVDAELAAAWSPGRAAEVRGALLATGVPYAEQASQSAVSLLDRYAQEWRAQGRRACEAARVTGEQTEAILTRRWGCLESRKRDLQAVVDHLVQRADARLAAKAVDMAGSLPSLAACADVAALTDLVPPPDDPARAPKLARVREGLAKARAMVDAAELDEARAALEGLREDARQIGYRPLEGAVLYELGRTQGGAGEIAPAIATLREAALAFSAGRDDRGAFEARRTLVRLTAAFRVGDRGLAAAQAEEAEALLERLGSPAELVPLMLESQAMMARWRGDAGSAVSLLRQAVRLLAERDAGADSLDGLGARAALGNALLVLERYPEAIEQLSPALEKARALRGRENPTAIGALTNLAAATYGLGDTGAMERALALQEEAIGLWAELGKGDAPPAAWDRVMAAWFKVGLGRYAEAVRDLDSLEPLVRRLPDDYALSLEQLLIVKGSLLVYRGRSREALPAFRELQSLTERLKQDPVVPIALECVGYVLLELGRPAEALEALERSLRLFEASPSLRPSHVAGTKAALARALAALREDAPRAVRLAGEARPVLERGGRPMAWDLARLDRAFPALHAERAR